jgi:hypothetical protein
MLQDEIATYGHALTRAWTVVENLIRLCNPIWAST